MSEKSRGTFKIRHKSGVRRGVEWQEWQVVDGRRVVSRHASKKAALKWAKTEWEKISEIIEAAYTRHFSNRLSRLLPMLANQANGWRER